MSDPADLARRLAERYPDDPAARALAEQLAERDRDLRDRLLDEAAQRFWPGKSRSESAQHLHAALDRYSNTGWLHDRQHDKEPKDPRRRAWFRILQAHPRVLSADRIRKILGRISKTPSATCDSVGETNTSDKEPSG